MTTERTNPGPPRRLKRMVGRRRTGYKDKNGKTIREGDTLEGNFTAEWDEEVWITRRFKVVKDPSGRWLCDGDKSNDENDRLANFENLEICRQQSPMRSERHRKRWNWKSRLTKSSETAHQRRPPLK